MYRTVSAPRPNAIKMEMLPIPDLEDIKWSRYSNNNTPQTVTDKLENENTCNSTSHSEKNMAEMESTLIWIRRQASIERKKPRPLESSAEPAKVRRSENDVETNLITGNSYYGPWNRLGFNGRGMYRFADGPLYSGDFKDGHFHGHGILTFPNGNKIEGFWDMGITQYMTFTFEDGLEYEMNGWGYCQEPDRRYVSISLLILYVYLSD